MQKKIIRKISKSNGFTLIELLIVVVTMTLLFGVGFANYRDFQKREYLKTADKENLTGATTITNKPKEESKTQ